MYIFFLVTSAAFKVLGFDSGFMQLQLNEIRKANSDLVVVGKAALDYKEDFDAEAEEDDADNIEESDGDEFEQETG